jgi:hypothetical protein|tara:strand:- start:5439 stop:5642 length:204 start_codon:yes stop_codon:yes gene_type:complete
MSQKKRVHEYLKTGKTLTSADAYERLGIASFPKRICELREMGIKVKDRWKRVKTRFSGTVSVKEYYL